MIIAKGFGAIPALASNTSNATATIGELSNKARTFSKDILLYNSPTVGEEVTLNLFSVLDNNVPSNIPVTIANKALTVINGLFNHMKTQGTVQVTPQSIVTYLTAQYGNEFTQIAIGDPVFSVTQWMPSWLSIQTTDAAVSFKIWFSNSHFESQYDVHEIILIPPVLDVTLLLTTTIANVNAAIAAQTGANVALKIKAVVDVAPVSDVFIEHVDWVNTSNTSETKDTVWTILVRGAGVGLEDIKTAIKDYLNTHSSSVDLFRPVLPSLFGGTVFKITPFWDKISIPNATISSAMYSSILDPSDIIEYALLTKSTETQNYITANAQGSYLLYKGLAFSIVGKSDNANNKHKFVEMYPDYLPIQTTSNDFNRLAPTTQLFIRLMMDMVQYAEVLDNNTALPPALSKQTDAGLVYVVGTLNGVTYMMASRASIAI